MIAVKLSNDQMITESTMYVFVLQYYVQSTKMVSLFLSLIICIIEEEINWHYRF